MKTAVLIHCMVFTGLMVSQGQTISKPLHEAGTVYVRFTPDYRPLLSPADTVYFDPSRKLVWEDFQGVANLQGQTAAESYSSFWYIGHSRQVKDTAWVYLTLQIFLVKSASWVRPDSRTAYDLAHEQLHFDITAIAAYHFRDTVIRDPYLPGDYNSRIQYLFLDGFRYMNSLQEAYDRETDHGMDPMQQRKWEEMVTRWLKQESGSGIQ